MAEELTLDECFRVAERLGTFQIPWGHVRELAKMSVYELCALSVGLSPVFVESVDSAVSPASNDTLESLVWKQSYSPPFEYFEARRRCAVAITHLGPGEGSIPACGEAAGPQTIVRVLDFLRWARERMRWSMPAELEAAPIDSEAGKTDDVPIGIAPEAGCDRSTTESPGTRELQLRHIVQTALTLSFDPHAIPRGGKKQIKDICLAERKDLFTDTGFDHAWKAASKGEKPIVRMKDHKIYSRRC